MAKKRTPPAKAATAERAAVTAERFSRLYRLLQLLATGPQTRSVLTRRLRLDVRGFYRDLELLRSAGIPITLTEGRYALAQEMNEALSRLPFPDPRLTLGAATELARGRTPAHRKLKEQIDRLRS